VRSTAYHVKEREVLLLLADIGEFLPLSLGGINTGGVLVVRFSIESGRSNLHGHKHAAR
jgi:hypothetical protein